MIKIFVWIASAALLLAQNGLPEEEQRELSTALGEASGSPHEFVYALEKHLRKHPDSKSKPEIERALVKSSVEIKDDRRIVKYGEQVLARESEDLQTVEAVTKALVRIGGKEQAERAVVLGRKWEQMLRSLEPKPGEKIRWQMRTDLDQGVSRSLTAQANALLALGKAAEAEEAAAKGYSVYASEEGARALAAARGDLGKWDAAVDAWCDAFVSGEGKNAGDMEAMRATWRKAHSDEKGLGDRLISAYDRYNRWNEERMAKLREYDVNALKGKPAEFMLTGVKGEKLPLSSLKGKVVVLDFWATWCGPCRAQHPLYERVKERFASRNDVEFVYLSTDEDKNLVLPFLEEAKWDKNVFYESGLSRLMQVSSIPTTIILNKRGEVASRMNGFIAERFVDLLTERVQRILAE